MSDLKPRERWCRHEGAMVVHPNIDAFIEDVIAVCRQHGMSISHEDGHGSFLIEPYSEVVAEWLRRAVDDMEE